MSKFTNRLWRDLEREHGPQLARTRRRDARRAGQVRPRLLVGTTAGLAGIGTAIALVLSAASTPAAFAVTGNPDGTVSVVLQRMTGIRGANQRLAALGVRAKFVEVAPGCRSALPPGAVAALKNPNQVLIHAGRQTRIDPRTIPPGRVLTIVSWSAARSVHVARLGVSVRAAPDCIAGPPPRALRIAWAMAHGCHVALAALPGGAVLTRPGPAWRITGKNGNVTVQPPPTGNSGLFTGNSGAPAGNSGSGGTVRAIAPPRQIRLPAPGREIRAAKGCPKPEALPKPPPGTGNSGSTGNS